jgi:hypothetical protein
MNKLLQRISTFRAKAQTTGLRVHIHSNNRASRVDRFIVYTSLIVGALGIGAAHLPSSDTPPMNKPAQESDYDPNDEDIKRWADTAMEQLRKDQEAMYGYAGEAQEPALNYITVRYQGKEHLVLDEASRLRLVKEAAKLHDLESVGLNWKDLYGVIHAETAWVSRTGVGKNKVQSHGLAQLEPNTAEALNIDDPNDPIQAVSAAAMLIKEAATWSNRRISKLKLSAKERNYRLREGVSIYYNTSTRLRNTWDGTNTHIMPIETQHHINNTLDGASLAKKIHTRLNSVPSTQESNHRRDGLTVAYKGNLDGNTPLLTQFRASSILGADIVASAATVQPLLDQHCAIHSRADNLSAKCRQAYTHPIAQALDGQALFTNMAAAGFMDDVPVYIARNSTPDVMTAVRTTETNSLSHDVDQQHAIVITSSMVKALKGPHQRAALAFLIARQLAYIEGASPPISVTPSDNLETWTEMDRKAVQSLRRSGYNQQDIAAAVNLTLEIDERTASPSARSNATLLDAHEQRKNHLESLIQNLSPLDGNLPSSAKRLQNLLHSQCSEEQVIGLDLGETCQATNPLIAPLTQADLTTGNVQTIEPNAVALGTFDDAVVAVDRGNLSVNAYAIRTNKPMTAGKQWLILVTQGLVDRYAGNPAMMTFVLSHELAHLRLNHSAAHNAAQLHRQELEADAFAVNYMRQSGYTDEDITRSVNSLFKLFNGNAETWVAELVRARTDAIAAQSSIDTTTVKRQRHSVTP